MIKLIERIANFLRSQEVKPFALAVLVIGFFFLYIKVYFVLNGYEIGSFTHQVKEVAKELSRPDLNPSHWSFWVNLGKDLLYFVMSFITALGASLITITVIIHSKNRDVPTFFAIFDGAFSLFFFGNGIPKWFQEGQYGYIGLAIAWSIFTAVGLYYLAEMFYEDSKALAEKEEREKQTHQALKEQIAELLAKVEELSQSLLNANARNESLSKSNQDLTQRLDDLSQKHERLSLSLNGKQSETAKLVSELETIREQNKALQLELWEKKNNRRVASKRGYITQLRNEGRHEEADQKEKELNQEIEEMMQSEGIDSELLDMSISSNGNGNVY